MKSSDAALKERGDALACESALRFFALVATASLLSVAADQCRAQVQQPVPAEPPLELPSFEPEEPTPSLRLPTPAPVPEERFPTLRVFVRNFVISGNTVFTTAELDVITAPYENREITNEELQEVQHRLTLHYVNAGYINSGAVIPDQQVADGIVRIDIVEGRLTDISVEGTQTLKPEFVADRLELGAGPPLNVNELGERVQILTQSPFIRRINADLKPGAKPGEARLDARIEEPTPYQLTLGVDNQVVPSLGDVRGFAQGTAYNLTGRGDVLRAEVDFAQGMQDLFGSYSLPLTARDLRLTLLGETETTEVVNDFQFLDITSEFWSLGFRLSQPIYQTPQDTLTLGVGFDRRHSQTFLLGRGFPFSPGVEPNGDSDVSVIRFSQEFIRRSRNQVLAARSTFSFGIDAFGATVNDSGPSAEYFAWLGQFQWARRLDDRGSQLLLRIDTQLTPDELLPMEQFAVGGALSVRGYQENALVRDYGFSGSLEYRYPVVHKNGRSILQLAAFVDGGGAWYNGVSTPDPTTIWSPGVGILYDPHPRVHAELYYGIAMEDIPFAEDSLSNDGIHFQVVVSLFD